jgi:hypothetical protein
MGNPPNPFTLNPGDCLLYSPSDFFGLVIAIKTYNWISHVEVYAGDKTSVASRDGMGVNKYAYRSLQLAMVLRPNGPFNFGKAMGWFNSIAKGQKYDWKGLLCFTLAVKQGSKDRMFCSEFATNFYRAGGFEPFQPDYLADLVAPAQFRETAAFIKIWKKSNS